MIALLLAGSLYAAAASAGDRPLPQTAYEIHQAEVEQGSNRDAVWLITTGFADTYSTAIALDRCPSCYEANGILPNGEARIALKAATTAVAWAALRDIRQQGHKRRADRIRWAMVAFNVGLTANNIIHTLRSQK